MGYLWVLLLLQVPTYEDGLSVLQKDGVEAAISYYSKGVKETGDPGLLFGLAWAFWKQGEFQRAEDTCNFLLSKKSGKLVQARTYYLLGHIVAKRDSIISVSHFEKALSLFLELGRPLNIYHSYESLGYACFKASDLDEAEKYLSKALEVHRSEKLDVNLGYFYSIKSRMAFLKRDIDEALKFTRQSRFEYEKTGDNRVYNELVSEAFFYLLLGKNSDGISMMEKIDKDALAKELTQIHIYNAVNWIFVYRCNHEDYESLKKYVMDFIKESDDYNLKELLDLALTIKCP